MPPLAQVLQEVEHDQAWPRESVHQVGAERSRDGFVGGDTASAFLEERGELRGGSPGGAGYAAGFGSGPTQEDESLVALCGRLLKLIREREEEEREERRRRGWVEGQDSECAEFWGRLEGGGLGSRELTEWVEGLHTALSSDASQSSRAFDVGATRFLMAHACRLTRLRRGPSSSSSSVPSPVSSTMETSGNLYSGSGRGYSSTAVVHDGVRYASGAPLGAVGAGGEMDVDLAGSMSSQDVAWAVLSRSCSDLHSILVPESAQTRWPAVRFVWAPLWVESYSEVRALADRLAKAQVQSCSWV